MRSPPCSTRTTSTRCRSPVSAPANLVAILDNYPRSEEMRGAVSDAAMIGAEERLVVTPSFRVVQVNGEAEVYTLTARARYPDGSYW